MRKKARVPRSGQPEAVQPRSDLGEHPGSGWGRQKAVPHAATRSHSSAVRNVAKLLGDDPAGIKLDMPAISVGLAAHQCSCCRAVAEAP